MKPLLAISLCLAGFVPIARGQLFSDNFTRGADPGPLMPWTTNSGGGNWTVTGGVMRGGTNAPFTYGWTFITNTCTNFSVQARLQFPVGAYGGGLGGRLNPATGERYAVWVYPENSPGGSSVLKLLKFTDYSSFSVLQQTNLAAVGTSFHTVKLEFTSASQVNVYFDGTKLLSATDTAPYSSGAVSLEFWTDAAGYLFTADDVEVNALPLEANNDTYSAVSGLPLRTTAPGVLGNDTGGLAPLTALLASAPAHGTLTFTNNGGFTYTATNGYAGADGFTYRATDGVTMSSVATVSITVTANRAPVASNDAFSVVQDMPLTIPAPGVLANDTDADGNSLDALLVSGVAHGTLNLSADGGFSYTPTAGFAGTDSFTYRANDGLTNSAEATVTISVLSLVPLYADSFTRTTLWPWLAQSGNWAVTGGALRGGPNTPVSYAVAYLTNSWTHYSVQASVQLPAGAFGAGLDACLDTTSGARYAAWVYPEGSGGGAGALKLIKFQNWTDFTVMQQTSLPGVGTTVHTLKLACAGDRIAVFFDGALMISMTDSAAPYFGGAIGVDLWTDATGYQISVDDVLVACLANDDTYSMSQDTTLTVAAPGVLGNDTELYGLSLTAALVSGPTTGALSLSTNGGFTYTPGTGFTGISTFIYEAIDGPASLGTGIVRITVSSAAPSNHVFFEHFDGLTAPALPAGWTTSATGAESPWATRTTASDTAPNAAYVTNADNVGLSDLVSPSIALPGGQNLLSFRNYYQLEGNPPAGLDGGVLEIKIGAGSFTDILAAGGSFVSGGYNATIATPYGNALAGRQAWSGNSGGFITTMVNLPAAAAGRNVQLRWQCGTDNSTASTGWYIDTVAITNCPCACCWNTPPLLAAQADRKVDELATVTIVNTATDADVPAQTLTYQLLSPPAGAVIDANGVITWTPTEAQGPGTYALTTQVTDNGSPSLSATNSFTVVVNEANSAPTLPAQADRTVLELSTPIITNRATDADLPANTLAYTLLAPPSGAVIDPDGVITWTPTEAQGPGTYALTTQVTDNGFPGLSATNSFTVVVNEFNSPPVLPAQANRTVVPLATLSVTNSAIDPDLPADTLTYTLLLGPTNATLDTNTGVITWTPTEAQDRTTNVLTTVVTDFNPAAVNTQHLSATNSCIVVVLSAPVVVPDAATLVGEGSVPTNNAIDPGEMVTVVFALKNVGTGADTTSLVATLLATNGVLLPSGPQAYGALAAGGVAVSQPFTFLASGACGGTVTPTLQLQDGPANLGTVAVSFPLGQLENVVILTQNFDSVTAPALPPDWTTSATNAGSNWRTTSSNVDTTPNAAFTPDATSIGISDLLSPPISLSNAVGPFQLSFRNNYNLEYDDNGYYDGGVLEIKIGSDAFVDITNAGSVFLNGGYNARISSGYESPISNRWAWSGTSTGYVTTIVSLPASVSGQTIQLRWRCVADTGGPSGAGWRIDSIGLTGNGYVCSSDIAPLIQAVSMSNGLVTVTWSAVAGRTYRLQSKDLPTGTNWVDRPPEVSATGPTATVTNAVGSATQQFYRVFRVP